MPDFRDKLRLDAAQVEEALKESASRHWETRLAPMARADILRAARTGRLPRRSAPAWLDGFRPRPALGFAAAAALVMVAAWVGLGGAWLAPKRPPLAAGRGLEIASTAPGDAAPSRRRPSLSAVRRPEAPTTSEIATRETPAFALPATMSSPASLLAHAPDVRRPPMKLSSLSRARRAAKAARVAAEQNETSSSGSPE